MSILSQEIVDYLNQGADPESGEWLQRNPVIGNFVTCPCISVRPTAIPHARRIVAFENTRGRFVDIHYRDGSHRYIVNVPSQQVTVESIERFIGTLETAGGHCHVERAFLILFVPASYHVSFENVSAGLFILQRDMHENIGQEQGEFS